MPARRRPSGRAGRRAAAPAGAAALPACRTLHAARLWAGQAEVRDALLRLGIALRDWGLGADQAQTVELLLAEALNNVSEHAYAGHGGRVFLHVALCPATRAVQCTVCDRGGAMPGGAAPAGAEPALDVACDSLPEGGFGWFLIRTLAVGLRYRRRSGVNWLRFRVENSAGPPPPDGSGMETLPRRRRNPA